MLDRLQGDNLRRPCARLRGRKKPVLDSLLNSSKCRKASKTRGVFRRRYSDSAKPCSVAVELVFQPAVLPLVPGAGTVLVGHLVDVVGDEATLRAGQRDEATLSVAASQIVVLVGRRVWGGAQERGVLGVRPGFAQVGLMLPSDHVVHVRARAVASLSWGPGSVLIYRSLCLLSSPEDSE